jgi:hypothetical protein
VVLDLDRETLLRDPGSVPSGRPSSSTPSCSSGNRSGASTRVLLDHERAFRLGPPDDRGGSGVRRKSRFFPDCGAWLTRREACAPRLRRDRLRPRGAIADARPAGPPASAPRRLEALLEQRHRSWPSPPPRRAGFDSDLSITCVFPTRAPRRASSDRRRTRP